MLKKTSLVLWGLAVNSIAISGTMGPVCTPANVTVPCVQHLWDIGLQGLYLNRVVNAERSYIQTTPVQNTGYYSNNNHWDWGFKLEGSYHFNTGNDVTLNWVHYKGDVDYAATNGRVLTATNIPYVGREANRFDQVNAVFGQHADFGLVKKMRFYGGLQYADIQENAANLYSYSTLSFTSASLFNNTEFRGIGPVIGLDYSYNLTDAFSLTANGASSILYGTSRLNTGYSISPSNAIVTSVYAKRTGIVPSLEAKLGLNYAYNMLQGVVNFEGGYQVMNYFNALQAQNFPAATNRPHDSDYGLYGPYFGIKYVGLA